MSFTVATFNLQNLISPGGFGDGPDEDAFRWKVEWVSDQLLAMDADVVAFQEAFDEAAVRAVVARTDEKARALAAGGYGGTLWRGGPFRAYGPDSVVFAPNMNGREGRPRPALALVSRHPVIDADHVQAFGADALATDFVSLADHGAGSYRLDRLSRPIQRVRLRVEGRSLTVFNAHLKAPAGEFPFMTAGSGGIAPERDLLAYDAVGRAMGVFRSAVRNMAEAVALRREIVAELDAGRPVVVMGDMNHHEGSVAAAILGGEAPEGSYEGDAKPDGSGLYAPQESRAIRERIAGLRMHSAARLHGRGLSPGALHTTRFGGEYGSLDRIMLSADFLGRRGRLEHLRVLHDHLNDGGLPPTPFDALASDHGQLVARLAWC